MPVLLPLPAGLDAAALALRLAPLGRLRAGAPRTVRLALLDSFDWRLHRAGWRLEQIKGRRPSLCLRPLGAGAPLARQPGATGGRAVALPPGPVRERIEPVLEPRALLTVAVLDVTTTPLLLEGRGGRPSVRFALESALAGAPGAEPSLPVRPALVLPDGHRAAGLRELAATCADGAPGPADAVAAALEPLGRVPRDYSGKIRVPLDPAVPARAATCAVLLHLLGTLEANLPGLRADLDPEFLHDVRVAVRRTRSALGQVKGVFPPATATRFAAAIGRLQEITGPARDWDVLALELPALGLLLPPRARRSLGPLARLIERRRRAAHARLVADLDAPGFAALLAAWRAFLMLPTPRRPAGAPNALRPVGAVAAERIRKLHRRALREGAAIGAASPAADLHELRKTCKKLRYLVEFFHALLEPKAADAAVASLKGLQDILGRFQDLQVQSATLLALARDLARERQAPPPAYLAIGMLVERLREQQQLARGEFAGSFAEFSRASNRRRWKKLIASATRRPGAPPAEPTTEEPQHG
jgi:CHAD domain-containing protein